MNEPAATPAEGKRKPNQVQFMLRALSSRNYRLFFGGQMMSLAGTWMSQIAMAWLVYRMTGSPLLLGVVGFSGQIPAFLIGPVAGVLVDRFPRHRMLVGTQTLAMLQSFLLAVLTLGGHIQVWHIIVLSVFQGLINAFDIPARQAFVVEMVENREDLSNAIALNSSMFNLARLVGPALGAMLIAAVGEGWCFMIDSVSYVFVIGALLAMHVAPFIPPKIKTHPLQALRDGWSYAFGSLPIRSILTLMAWISLLGMPYGVLMPVMADGKLHGDAHTLGVLMASSGLGALLGALFLAARKNIRGLGRMIPLWILVFSIGLMAFSQSNWLWLSALILVVMGFALMTQIASCNIIVQTIVDDDKRGRVMSLYAMAFMGLAPFGSLGAGALAERISAPSTLLISGVGCLGAALFFYRRYPAMRAETLPIYARMGLMSEQEEIALGVEHTSRLARPPVRQI